MPSFLSRLFGGAGASARAQDLDVKASRTGALLAMHSLGRANWTPRNASELTRQGFERNAIVYRCVRMIAESAATIPWLVYEKGIENEDHLALALLNRPNAAESSAQFLEGVFTNLMLFGNAYVEIVDAGGGPREWHNLRPDRMAIVPGPSGWPAAYEYTVGAQKISFPVETDGVSPILHLKLFHPLDDHYGFAPIFAAQGALDVHNASSGWNKALLDNAARPSGALVYHGPDGAALGEEQFDRLRKELDENFSGSRNAGRPLLLEGGLDWKALSLSPKDMDFVEARAAAAREIALAFGIPPLVLGLPGDNTFSNFQEANRAFWRQAVIPLVQRTQKSFAHWLEPVWGNFDIKADLDSIDALAGEREMEWRRVGAASFLSDDEKREAVGYKAAREPGRSVA
jgi:HK97 family phage portal protein